MKILITFLLNFTFLVFNSLTYAAPPVNKSLPVSQNVGEDTPLTFTGVTVEDPDGNLASVKLSVAKGTLKVTVPAIDKDKPVINGNNTATVTLTGTETQINLALASFSYQGNLNYRGSDTLTMLSTDSTAPTPETDSDTVSIKVNVASADSRCTSYTKPSNEGLNPGDLFSRLSVGSVANYSVVRYNLADKKSSLNTQGVGFGPAFRYYTKAQLHVAGTDNIANVPAACRAKTEDLLDFFQGVQGELPKIGAAFSFSPTFYVFKEQDANDLGTQLALNFGFLNDFLTIGVGWNLSGKDAGEWFILAGPSFGFKF